MALRYPVLGQADTAYVERKADSGRGRKAFAGRYFGRAYADRGGMSGESAGKRFRGLLEAFSKKLCGRNHLSRRTREDYRLSADI